MTEIKIELDEKQIEELKEMAEIAQRTLPNLINYIINREINKHKRGN